MSENESQEKHVDRSEFAANLAIYGWPFLLILVGYLALSIDKNYGDTAFVQWVKTGRMDGAAENFVPDPEFDGERGKLVVEGDVPEPGFGAAPQIGQEWNAEWGPCGIYNSPDVLDGMSDPNGDGIRDSYDVNTPIARTAWDMVPIYFAGSSEGPFFVVVNDEVVEVRADLTDPRFNTDVNGEGVCKVDQ